MNVNLNGKVGLVIGIANEHSIAWGCAKHFHESGAQLIVTYPDEKTQKYTEHLAKQVNAAIYTKCDVTIGSDLDKLFKAITEKFGRLDFILHSIAFAPKRDLHGRVIDCSKVGFNVSMDISCYSLIQICKLAEPLMQAGGSVLTVSYYGADKVIEHYNIMGVVKAALESTTRYLAHELGAINVRVNALSPGPLMTRAGSGIVNFDNLIATATNKSPLKRVVNIDSIGHYATFLVSDLARDVTGDVVFIDAGLSILG